MSELIVIFSSLIALTVIVFTFTLLNNLINRGREPKKPKPTAKQRRRCRQQGDDFSHDAAVSNEDFEELRAIAFKMKQRIQTLEEILTSELAKERN